MSECLLIEDQAEKWSISNQVLRTIEPNLTIPDIVFTGELRLFLWFAEKNIDSPSIASPPVF